MSWHQTIAAISTPHGVGGIGIVRVSGSEAIEIVDQIFSHPKGEKLSSVSSHTIHYGNIVDEKNQIIDEVLVSVMHAPRTFTGEETVEINCHGGLLNVRKVLEEVIRAGARLANQGEFTKRAFLNGKLDLSQAEAVIDVIHAKSEDSLKQALGQLEGLLKNKIDELRLELLQIVSHLQAEADFPEEDISPFPVENIQPILEKAEAQLNWLLETSKQGKVVKEGLITAIVGKPNVGKSSLLNALLREERAIVTNIPGTTRDILEESVNVGGVLLKMMDTAGIRDTEDVVEKMGVERAKKAVEEASLVIYMLDASEDLTEEDKLLAEWTSDYHRIVLMNKMDMSLKLCRKQVEQLFGASPIIEMSLKDGIGIELLENEIRKIYESGKISNNQPVITNDRQKESILHARNSIREAKSAWEAGIPVDLLAVDLTHAIGFLGEVIGLTVSDEIIDRIFHQFCLGK